MIRDEGLRERKKREARAAMSQAALRSALTEGLRAVSAESVAERVGVSPRTFRNYFSSVEEAVVDGLAQRGLEVADALADRPADEPVWDSLLVLVPQHATALVGSRADAAGLFAMFDESPALVAHQLAAFVHVEARVAEVLAARLHVDPLADPTPVLIAASVMVAVRVAVEQWVRGHGDTLPDLVLGCLALVRAGLPAPSPTAAAHR
jgi:AcrR family transcriptional regulator